MSFVNAVKVANVVRDAGGVIVGRTKLQKVTYLLSLVGLEQGMPFYYKHYGPFSEEVATAARQANLLGLLSEEEQVAGWGGSYSTYTVADLTGVDVTLPRVRIAREAAAADAVELELAATAAFLAEAGFPRPWDETARRKPEKVVGGRLNRAKALYRRLSGIGPTPSPWPIV
jgi:hypothetical protein